MTYELPDEVRREYWAIHRMACREMSPVDFERSMNILAAHFERIGAEKMREAAAALADDWDVKAGPGSKAHDVYGKQMVTIEFAVKQLRALPLPPQTTTNTEEATPKDSAER